MSADKIGTLTIKVIRAKLKRDTEAMGQMDPFVVIQYLKNKFKTEIIKGGGKTPSWNQAFDIDIYSLDHIIKITCLDKDFLVNDTIGESLVRTKALVNVNGKRSWISIHYKKEYAGEILIECNWKAINTDIFQEEEPEEIKDAEGNQQE